MNEPFHLADGTIIRSVEELIMMLDRMSKETFGHHVNAERNDFADWLDKSMWRGDLATAIRNVKSASACKETLIRVLVPVVKVEAEQFHEFKDSQASHYDQISDRFESFTKRVQSVQTDTQLEQEIQLAEEKYKALKDAISDARKHGKDPFIASLMLRSVPPKIAFARASGSRQDLILVMRSLDEARKELDDELKTAAVDVRAEVLAMARASGEVQR